MLMGLRTTIQARLIALFKVDSFEVVTYADDIPSVGHGTETPTVTCNEVSAGIEAGIGGSTTYDLKNWAFDLLCDFKKEVDFSDFIESLENMSFSADDNHLVVVTVGSNVIANHPPRQGAHGGTQLRFSINIDIKK